METSAVFPSRRRGCFPPGVSCLSGILQLVLVILSTFTNPCCSLLDAASIICNRIEGLTPRQRQICRYHPDAMAAAGDGAAMAIVECQFQFRFRRWNCSLVTDGGGGGGALDHMSSIGSREAAFVYAIRSAGIAHAVTKACTRGDVAGCGCPRPNESRAIRRRSASQKQRYRKPNGTSMTYPGRHLGASNEVIDGGGSEVVDDGSWQWGGCGEDVEYGLRFSKAFLDSREMEENSHTLMNKHNNRVGRKAIADNVRLVCKCHGASGSCTARTCWNTQPQMRVVGEHLALAYGRALQVVPVLGQRAMRPIFLKLRRSAAAARSSSEKDNRKPSPGRLVYLVRSPDYCEPDARYGATGTHGRLCGQSVTRTVIEDSNDVEGFQQQQQQQGRRRRRMLDAPSAAAAVPTDDCESMCCGRPYEIREFVNVMRCQCRFHWCCYVTCDTCRDVTRQLVCR